MAKPTRVGQRLHNVIVITSQYRTNDGQPRILVATPDGTPQNKVHCIERIDLDPAIVDVDRALDVLERTGRWLVCTAPAQPHRGYWTVKAVAR